MPRARAARWMTAVGAAVALAALWFGRSLPAGALVLDLATGGVVMACGVIATVRVQRSRSGALLFAVGLTWFFADFAMLPGPLGLVASSLTYVHRGFLVHLLLTFPTGRNPGRAWGTVIALGYGLSLVPASLEHSTGGSQPGARAGRSNHHPVPAIARPVSEVTRGGGLVLGGRRGGRHHRGRRPVSSPRPRPWRS